MSEPTMRAWWVSDYDCYAGRTAEEARAAHLADTGIGEDECPLEDVREAGPGEKMSMTEAGTPPLFNIRAEAAKMTEPGFLCGTET